MTNRIVEFAINGMKVFGAGSSLLALLLADYFDVSGWFVWALIGLGGAFGVIVWGLIVYAFAVILQRVVIVLGGKEKPHEELEEHLVQFTANLPVNKRGKVEYMPFKRVYKTKKKG